MSAFSLLRRVRSLPVAGVPVTGSSRYLSLQITTNKLTGRRMSGAAAVKEQSQSVDPRVGHPVFFVLHCNNDSKNKKISTSNAIASDSLHCFYQTLFPGWRSSSSSSSSSSFSSSSSHVNFRVQPAGQPDRDRRVACICIIDDSRSISSTASESSSSSSSSLGWLPVFALRSPSSFPLFLSNLTKCNGRLTHSYTIDTDNRDDGIKENSVIIHHCSLPTSVTPSSSSSSSTSSSSSSNFSFYVTIRSSLEQYNSPPFTCHPSTYMPTWLDFLSDPSCETEAANYFSLLFGLSPNKPTPFPLGVYIGMLEPGDDAVNDPTNSRYQLGILPRLALLPPSSSSSSAAAAAAATTTSTSPSIHSRCSWLPFFAVSSSIDVHSHSEHARSLGAKTVLSPMQLPTGLFSILDDPQGNPFAIYHRTDEWLGYAVNDTRNKRQK